MLERRRLTPRPDLKRSPSAIPKTHLLRVVRVTRTTARITSLGYTAPEFSSILENMSEASRFYCWEVSPARNGGGERILGYLDLVYTRRDLPERIELSPELMPPPYSINFGRSPFGSTTMELREAIHLYIAGLTGNGKSVLLRSLTTQILYNHHDAQIYAIDFKAGKEFAAWRDDSRVQVASEFEAAADLLDRVYREYLRRSQMLLETNYESVYDMPEPPPVVAVVLDEAAEFCDLIPSKLARTKEFKSAAAAQERGIFILSKLARLARFVGIHLILATQRPDASAVPQQIRSQCKTRLITRVVSKEDSIMLIGRAGAAKLPDTKGRFILMGEGGQYRQLQGYFIEPERAADLARRGEARSPREEATELAA